VHPKGVVKKTGGGNMTNLVGRVISTPYKKGKRLLYKYMVLDGQYEGVSINHRVIEVYGAILTPSQKRTLLSISGVFGRSRKNSLPIFCIKNINDLSGQIENVAAVGKYFGILLSQDEYKLALTELGVSNYIEAVDAMLDIQKYDNITQKYPTFGKFIYYIQKETQVVKLATLFDETNCGLGIGDAIQVYNELRHRANSRKKNVVDLLKMHPWILTQVLDQEIAESAAEIIAQHFKFTEEQKLQGRISSDIIRLLFERANFGDCFVYQSVIYARLLNKYHYKDIKRTLDYLSTMTDEPLLNRVFAGVVLTTKDIYEISQDTGRSYSKQPKNPNQYVAHYLPGIFYSEYGAAQKLVDIITTPIEPLDSKTILKVADNKLNKNQKAFIQAACANKITILTGEAGTGKTFVLRSFINAYKEATGDTPVVIAPTALASYNLGNGTVVEDNTQTIHRYAGIFKQSDADLAVGDGITTTIERTDVKMVIVDECSMLGPVVLRKLLDTITPETRLVFTGDPAQLPPVGAAGSFPALLKLAEEGIVAHVHLEENKRNSDDVIRVTNAIRNNTTNIPVGNTVKMHIVPENEIIEKLIECIESMGGYTQDTMILSPYRTKGKGKNVINVTTINEALSKEYGSKVRIGNTGFMVGDPVIAKRNDYANRSNDRTLPRAIKDIESVRTVDIYNGMRGVVTKYDQDTITIKYFTGRGGEAWYHIDELAYFVEQAYCTTVHKAQGSQAKKVILVLANAQNNRSLIYTGLTRCMADGEVHIITTPKFTLLSNESDAEIIQDDQNLAASQCLSSLKYMVGRMIDAKKQIPQHKPFKSKKNVVDLE